MNYFLIYQTGQFWTNFLDNRVQIRWQQASHHRKPFDPWPYHVVQHTGQVVSWNVATVISEISFAIIGTVKTIIIQGLCLSTSKKLCLPSRKFTVNILHSLLKLFKVLPHSLRIIPFEEQDFIEVGNRLKIKDICKIRMSFWNVFGLTFPNLSIQTLSTARWKGSREWSLLES